ncbi:nucleotide pyrophosphohydrolase [Tessaracoccus sp. Z1128]
MTGTDSITTLTDAIRDFARERNWEQFHDPKSLILALVGEVGELAELFQWVPADEAASRFAEPARNIRAAEELSDVLIYLLRLADVLGVDLADAAVAKLESAGRRYAPSEFSGIAPDKQ